MSKIYARTALEINNIVYLTTDIPRFLSECAFLKISNGTVCALNNN